MRRLSTRLSTRLGESANEISRDEGTRGVQRGAARSDETRQREARVPFLASLENLAADVHGRSRLRDGRGLGLEITAAQERSSSRSRFRGGGFFLLHREKVVRLAPRAQLSVARLLRFELGFQRRGGGRRGSFRLHLRSLGGDALALLGGRRRTGSLGRAARPSGTRTGRRLRPSRRLRLRAAASASAFAAGSAAAAAAAASPPFSAAAFSRLRRLLRRGPLRLRRLLRRLLELAAFSAAFSAAAAPPPSPPSPPPPSPPSPPSPRRLSPPAPPSRPPSPRPPLRRPLRLRGLLLGRGLLGRRGFSAAAFSAAAFLRAPRRAEGARFSPPRRSPAPRASPARSSPESSRPSLPGPRKPRRTRTRRFVCAPLRRAERPRWRRRAPPPRRSRRRVAALRRPRRSAGLLFFFRRSPSSSRLPPRRRSRRRRRTRRCPAAFRVPSSLLRLGSLRLRTEGRGSAGNSAGGAFAEHVRERRRRPRLPRGVI